MQRLAASICASPHIGTMYWRERRMPRVLLRSLGLMRDSHSLNAEIVKGLHRPLPRHR